MIILSMKVMVIKVDRNLSLDEYLYKTEPYLRNIIIEFQNSNI